MKKKNKQKSSKDERPMKAKGRKTDRRVEAPGAPKTSSTKKYRVSSSARNISSISINDDDVDDILRMLLELEMNEGGFESVDAYVAHMLGESEKEKESSPEIVESDDSDSQDESDSDEEGDSDSDSDDHSESESESENVNSSNDDSSSVGVSGNKIHENTVKSLEEDQAIQEVRPDKLATHHISIPPDFVISSALRKFMKKKLIRDDRRLANELKAKQFDEKQRDKCMKKERYEKGQRSGKEGTQLNSKTPNVSSASSSSQDPKLRIQVCSLKNKSTMKVMTIDREKGWSVAELVGVVRTKLNEPKKFNSLMILPSKKDFQDEDIRYFENDTQLCLLVDTSKTVKKSADHAKKRNSEVVSTTKSDSERGEKINNADAIYDQPQKTIVGDISAPQIANDTDEATMDASIDVSSPFSNDPVISYSLQQEKEAMLSTDKYQQILAGRQNLPMYKARDSFLSELNTSESNTAIVIGDTGCGKTTQVPQILLDNMIDLGKGSETYIICTQPRRIAAVSVAERVSQERMQRCGQGVGYQIRLKSKFNRRDTRILFCTTGILLRKIQDKKFLDKVSHIIIDEVHERQVETDFLLAILKTEMSFREQLHLILMSATLNSHLLQDYMNHCPVIRVPGRIFPVEIHYLNEINSIIKAQQMIHSLGGDSRVVKEDLLSESSLSTRKKKKPPPKGRKVSDHNDTDVIPPQFNAETVAEFIIRLIEKESASQKSENEKGDAGSDKQSESIGGSKAILVFLSGIQPITAVNNILRHRQILDQLKAKVFILHSSVPAEQQNRVFAKLQHPFEWKIVLSTNIAESSVTVDDVVHVIDTGFHREMTFDPVSSLSLLSTVFASRASMAQRCGRAGRVRPGDCWRMFSEEFMESPKLHDYSLPEIKRVPLEDVVLQILILNLGNPRDFLAKCMDRPSAEQIDEALQVLIEIGAIIKGSESPSLSVIPSAASGEKVELPPSSIQDLLYQPYLYKITPLGRHLANLPVDVRLGKMLIYASIFGCLEPALTIVATLSGKSPMVTPPNNRDEANAAHSKFCTSKNTSRSNKHPFFVSDPDSDEKECMSSKSSIYSPYSDHIAFVNIYNEFVRVDKLNSRGGRRAPEVYSFCKKNHLSLKVLDDIRALREQFRKYLSNSGFLGDNSIDEQLQLEEIVPMASFKQQSNYFSSSDAIVRCVICAGLFPRVVRVCKVQSLSSTGKSSRNPQNVQKMFEASGDTVNIHASSLLCRRSKALLGDDVAMYKDEKDKKKEAFLVYYKKIATPLPHVFDCTEVSPLSLMLFGDSFSELVKSKRSKVVVNKWIHLGVSEQNAVLIRRLRNEIEQILLSKAEGSKDSAKQSVAIQHIQKKQFLVTCILEKMLEQRYT